MSAGLFLAEMRRLLSRRFFRLLAIGAGGVVVVVAVVTFIQSSNDPNAGLAAARATVAECQSQQADPNVPQGDKQFRCPTVEQVQAELSRSFRYAETMPDALRGVSFALLALGFVIGGSFMGAEWGSGSMTTMLTWEPRRGRLLAAKAVAVAVTVAVFAVVALALVTVIFLPVASLRGSTVGINGALWRTMVGIWPRGAALAVFGSLVATALATLFRNSAGAVGTGFFYMAIVDPLLGTLWHARFRIWTVQHLVPRFLGLPVDVPAPSTSPVETAQLHLSATRPIVLLAIYAAGLLAVAYAAFRTRDVT